MGICLNKFKGKEKNSGKKKEGVKTKKAPRGAFFVIWSGQRGSNSRP